MVNLSVIVPVYNVEKYIYDCLLSIKNQSYGDFEVIIIDDGSSDNSLEICENFATKDKRFKVFSGENSGVSQARNKGLEKSSGKYITFVDSDDWVSLNMYGDMINKMESNQADLSMCGHQIVYENREYKKEVTKETKVLNKTEIVNELLPEFIGPESLNSDTPTLMGSVCKCIFKRDLIFENNLMFIENLKLMEDLVFLVNTLTKAERIVLVKPCYYYYRQNESSALHQYWGDMLKVHKDVYYMLEKLIDEQIEYSLINKQRLKNRYLRMHFSALNNESRSYAGKDLFTTLKNIKIIIGNPLFQKLIKKINTKNYTVRKKIFFYLLKNEMSLAIYIYFKVLNILTK